jgi:hypothetical protein
MANALAWSLFALGVVHIVFGIKKFRSALAGAMKAGFVGQFKAPEERRTAFWFLVVGPLLMFTGQVAIHAVSTGDSWLLRLIGVYLFITGALGVAAFPKSPLWAPLLLSFLFIATGYGIV